MSQTGLDRADRSVDQPRPVCLGMYACMRVSQTGLLGCVRIRACVSDWARPGRPVCLGMYACMRVFQICLLRCVRIRAYVSDRARPVCLLVLLGKL